MAFDGLNITSTITTPIALIAFVVGIVGYYFTVRTREQRKLIESAKEDSRRTLIDNVVRGLSRIDTDKLTQEQRYKLALKTLTSREKFFHVFVVIASIIAIIISILIAYVSYLHYSSNGLTPKLEQKTLGYQSPVINTSGGDVNIMYGQPIDDYQKIADELGVTKKALAFFFRVIEEKNVPLDELDKKLREIASNYKKLLSDLERFQADDPVINEFVKNAATAFELEDFDKAEDFLNLAADRNLNAANELLNKSKELEESAKNMLYNAGIIRLKAGEIKNVQLDYIGATTYFDAAASIFEKSEWELAALSYQRSGNAFRLGGNNEYALKRLRAALNIYEVNNSLASKGIATLYNDIGIVLGDSSQEVYGLQYKQRALKIAEDINDEELYATVINNLGVTYRKLGRYKEAILLYQDSLAKRIAIYGKSHDFVASTYCNLGIALASMGKHDEALDNYKIAIDIRAGLFGENHPNTAIVIGSIGDSLLSQNKYDEAILKLEEAYSIFTSKLGDLHPLSLATLAKLSQAYASMGNHDIAIKFLEKLLNIYEKLFGSTNSKWAAIANNLAVSYQATGRIEEAKTYFKLSLQIFEKNTNRDGKNLSVIIDNVYKDSQAQAIGLAAGDIIIEYNSLILTKGSTELIREIQNNAYKDKINLTILRGTLKKELIVKGGSLGIGIRDITLKIE